MRVGTGGRACIRVTFYTTLCVVAVLNMAILFSVDLLPTSSRTKQHRAAKQEQGMKKSPQHHSFQHPSSHTGQEILQQWDRQLNPKIQELKAQIQSQSAYKTAQNVNLSFVEETLSRLRSELLLDSSDLQQGADRRLRNEPKKEKFTSRFTANPRKDKNRTTLDKHASVTEKLPNIVIHKLAEPRGNLVNKKTKIAPKAPGKEIKDKANIHEKHKNKPPQDDLTLTNTKKKLAQETFNKSKDWDLSETDFKLKLSNDKTNHIISNTHAKKLTKTPSVGTIYNSRPHTKNTQKQSVKQLEHDKSDRSKYKTLLTNNKDKEKDLQGKYESKNGSQSDDLSKVMKRSFFFSQSNTSSSSSSSSNILHEQDKQSVQSGRKSQLPESRGKGDNSLFVPKASSVETKGGHKDSKRGEKEKKTSCIQATKTVGQIQPILEEQSRRELEETFLWLSRGGHYKPTNCIPKEKTAIIFPFRDRLPHLHTLLLNLLPLLKRQNIDFTIFVIDQEKPTLFNRGMLFNIGFAEALKVDDFDCFIFHDVDLIPLFDTNFYHCNENPTHFLGGVNKFQYGIMYNDLFGGVVSFTRGQFEAINGASNMYFGWGAEDDDLRKRILHANMTILRTDRSVGLYDMIKHSKDKTNPINPIRHWLLTSATKRMYFDGLSTLVYRRSSMDSLPLYTWIKVKIDARQIIMLSRFFTAGQKNRMLDLFVPAPKNRTATPL